MIVSSHADARFSQLTLSIFWCTCSVKSGQIISMSFAFKTNMRALHSRLHLFFKYSSERQWDGDELDEVFGMSKQQLFLGSLRKIRTQSYYQAQHQFKFVTKARITCKKRVKINVFALCKIDMNIIFLHFLLLWFRLGGVVLYPFKIHRWMLPNINNILKGKRGLKFWLQGCHRV